MGVYDASPEPQSEPGNKCGWAELMQEGQRLKSEYAELCLRAQMLSSDPEGSTWLTAEAEMGHDVANAAGRIVTRCTGCDDAGNYTSGGGCPGETRERVKEWFRSVGPMRYMGPPLDK